MIETPMKYIIETDDKEEMQNMLDASSMRAAIDTYSNVFRKYLAPNKLPTEAYQIISILQDDIDKHFEDLLC